MSGHAPRSWRRDELANVDRAFDQLIPSELRHLSTIHWTPVQVAVRAASLLCPTRDTRVLDLGSGIGKLCAIGALSGCGMWSGIEQHEPLVTAATRLARALGVSGRTAFVHGDVFSIDWSEYDALYLYNPFELALFGEPSAARTGQIARVQARLESLPECTRVVTFHGFGGVMPPSFELLYQERFPGVGLDLAMWIQRSTRRSPGELS